MPLPPPPPPKKKPCLYPRCTRVDRPGHDCHGVSAAGYVNIYIPVYPSLPPCRGEFIVTSSIPLSAADMCGAHALEC
jgi:hypothetical protein